MQFNSFDDIIAALSNVEPIDRSDILRKTQSCLNSLLKPLGSLGRLEEIVKWLAIWQQTDRPKLDNVQAIIFAGHHGIAHYGVSAYDADITEKMVLSFREGHAAINQICAMNDIALNIVPVLFEQETKNIAEYPAMTLEQCLEAFHIGFHSVNDCDLLVLGEMGIGNTTSAAAIASVLMKQNSDIITGLGTGVDNERLQNKKKLIQQAVTIHGPYHDPLDILCKLGGFEIAALVGALCSARIKNIPVLLDGFIVTSAAMVLHSYASSLLDNIMAAHQSDEKAHYMMLQFIEKEPLLNLNMRLGEGSGAALSVSLVRHSLNLYDHMGRL